ncbi:hypothetical protein FHS57_004189 [Runella defluvii]|uniref:DUF4292 domain-containing protein n=1 Tax=Runella defluvii TaxID=370973 RepID=A0A7W5ZQH5_9BACT|nr:DUF4292 domain-containing protein [Runella defluvii]MBB3840176.1 hypothetical protein [Runella defluvii]
MKKLLFSLTIVFASAAASFAQTADEIISKAIDARGGSAKLNALKSMRMESTTSVMGMDLASKSVIVHKRGMRNDIQVMGQSIVVAIDGDKGWTINPMQGSDPVALPDEQVKATASQLDLSGMANIKESGAVAELMGKETLDGNETFKVKLTSKDGTIMTHYIDTKTYLTAKTSIKVTVSGQSVEVDTKMSNYKVVDGISFPHTTEISNPQAGAIVTTITKLELNPTIDESIFAMPKK